MEFEEFAARAAEIEDETADLEIERLVAALLADANDDLAVLVRFVQGRVFPAWNSRTLDIGPRLCYEAISRAAGTNVTAADVEERLAQRGEIGEVAASYEFGGQQGLAAFGEGTDALTVSAVDEELRTLAAASGSGSQERKLDALFGLFNRCRPEEARYLARLVLSEMRIGVGSGTVRDAIGDAFDVPSEAVERALQVSNDYGLVAEIAREDGESGLSELTLEIGRPVQAMLAQTGTVADAIEDWGEVAAEWKFDGARCVSGYTPIYVKNRGATVVRDVNIGNEVLTHTGVFREVVDKNKRTIDTEERVFEFSTYLGETFKVTEGHELLVSRPEGTRWIPIESVMSDEWVVFPIPDPVSDDQPPVDLELTTVSNYRKTFECNPRFYRLLGYWVGDGSSNEYNGNQRISLVFNNEDTDLKREYRDLIRMEFGISDDRIHDYDHGGATSLYWTDSPFLKWLSKNFRKQEQDGWRDKTLPSWFWNITQDQFAAFLRGWQEADGYEDSRGRCHITTKERDLASTVQLIGLQFGYIMGFSRIRRSGRTYYELGLTRSNRHAKIRDDRLLVRILKRAELSRRSPQEVDPRQNVYNLQVAGDESYCCPMVAMHNCQIHYTGEADGVSLYSRNMEEVTDALPEIGTFVAEHLDERAILDGEVVAVDDDGAPLPFQEVLRRFRRKHDVERAREETELRLYAFDCLHAGGEDLLDAPLEERYERLSEALSAGVSERWLTDDAEEIAEIEGEALEAGHEGIMLKNPDSTYSPGRRGRNWRKRKPDVETLDLVVTGAEWGEGRRATFLGSFLLSVATGSGFETIGKVATGITDETLAELTELLEPHVLAEEGRSVEIRPEVVFEVGYEEIQRSPTYESGYALRFPRFLGVRGDKDPEDADSLSRIERLYGSEEGETEE